MSYVMHGRWIALFAMALLSFASQAEPAPWYWWVSKLGGSRVCNQTSLGEGWVQETKAFRDARCRIPLDRR